MSNSRGGFFSLNRLLGRKQKNEKNVTNSLSKFQTLARSTTNLEEISPQNKIAPLATVPNAPFEQSFRITVYLPHGQLYVARIGAKTKLSELLATICINKSLDSNKFVFRHPTDDTQVFDLSFTVGEVGLNEIKLVQKNSKEDAAVKYRPHSNSQENRLVARPHTISSVSPYSSTNSLTSSDSSGIMMNQRLSNCYIPAAPGRKKRAAPRPPSQNSIPEDSENKAATEQLQRSNLTQQNFHVSSPNLTANNNTMIKSNSNNHANTDMSISDNNDETLSEKHNKRNTLPNRPLSIQLSRSNSEYQEFKSPTFENTNSTFSRNHSRTSSEVSDITRDGSIPEPQPRTRPPIGKKKAPAPPPRTVSAISTGPIATPRNALQKLNEEEVKEKMVIAEASNRNDVQGVHSSSKVNSTVSPAKNPINVSKVMLNVSEIAIMPDQDSVNGTDNQDEQHEGTNSSQMNRTNETSTNHEASNVSKTQIAYSIDNKTLDLPTGKNVSVVDLSDSTNSSTNIDHNDISKQVNEIIDSAVQINEAKLNAENERKTKAQQIDEINNNNNDEICNQTTGKNSWNCKQYECRTTSKVSTAEIPIQPILNETRTFNFHEYSDNSLPASTTSTQNTAETPSTGPESLITSDIEDGYKGNELENKRKVEVTYQDSKEDFIESQFEFLQEHLDSKTSIESDDEKTLDFNKKPDIISSTMIADKSSSNIDKTDVINELTDIINSNRLDTFIKPNETNNAVETSTQSSLANFHIGAYTNGSHENNKFKTNSYNHTNANECGETGSSEFIDSAVNPNSKLETKTHYNGKSDETFVISKQIGRSRSFHSTFANIEDHEESTQNTKTDTTLSVTSRSSSYLSLNGVQKQEKCDTNTATSHLMGGLRRKSSSELSIADSPSLQSIEVIKSILSSSIKMTSDGTSDIHKSKTTPNTVKTDFVKGNQRKSQGNGENPYTAATYKSESANQAQTWKYQGPPAINFSTWGERPKSMVHIKSDNDYIFGGTSKMAALQKRFSGMVGENRNDTNSSSGFTSKTAQCESGSCKLPIVRGVEYKKNVSKTNRNVVTEDDPDATQQMNSFRSSYEVSRIVSEKLFTEKVPALPVKPAPNVSATQTKNVNPMKSFHSNHSDSALVHRVKSFNGVSKAQSMQLEVAKEKEPEKPIFTQFTLRKTGLKEKMIGESNDSNAMNNIKNGNKIQANVKRNSIPTAPKPPPILKKPKTRPVSMSNIQADPRNQLLDSIRNFKRDTLKGNVIY